MGEMPEWRLSKTPVPYPDAIEEMERRVVEIESGKASELVFGCWNILPSIPPARALG